MTTDEIKELIRVVIDTGIAELEVQRGDSRVRIRSAVAVTQDSIAHVPVPMTVVAPIASVPQPAGSNESKPPAVSPAEDDKHEIVKSPIVGTYYDAPAPGEGPFVRVGDRVEPKQVLCIIESMKLMNEIEADIAGTIIAKHIENGRPVEYGEALFTIKPA
jgi:acetyl-CoA carboxylase biotin carboxyl carrier protein